MTWTTLSFSFGSVLTAVKMTQMYDNFAAVCNKDAGAPVLANNYVVTAMLATDSVTADKIVASAVGTAEIADGNVTTVKLPDGAVTNTKLASNSVTHLKIQFALEAEGSWTIAVASLTQVVPAGFYMFVISQGSAKLEVSPNGGASWRTPENVASSGCLFSDGTNVRFLAVMNDTIIYYRRLS